MGLIRSVIHAAKESAKGVVSEQWKEYFYCESMDTDTLVMRGRKKTSSRSSNSRNDDNIISNGSGIVVADGQCMIIVEQGKIVEVCAESGEFTYDSSLSPSIFTGDLGETITRAFEEFGRRFTYGGDAAKDQRVYYFNTKEITENKFGTANPFMFRIVDHNINLDTEVSVRCNGIYSYRITNPLLFYVNVCGNIEGVYERSQIDGQLKTEFIAALQPAFAKLSDLELRPGQIPSHAAELEDAMNEVLTKKWLERRGITVVSVALNPITLKEEDMERIQQAQQMAVYRDPGMAAAMLAGAQAEAMKSAANNSNGAMMGFMGMNMASQAGGVNAQNLFQMSAAQQAQMQQMQAQQAQMQQMQAQQVQTQQMQVQQTEVQQPQGWMCSCGTLNKGKFCMECGKPKPAAEPLYKCDKCGWEPEDPKNPPKFCPECGDPFNDEDVQ